jgi:hypothetical protein
VDVAQRLSRGQSLRLAVTKRLFGRMYPRAQLAWRKRTGHPEWRFIEAFAKEYGTAVRHGPFRGMSYPPELLGMTSAMVPKLLGAYECELHEVIDEAAVGGYDTVVNIGAAEGYYAIGLARRLPDAVVHAFEADRRLQARCHRLAAANGVLDRVRVRGICGAGDLAEFAGRRLLVICDCEGCEFEIFGHGAGDLDAAVLVVEVHDFADAGSGAELVRCLQSTHDVQTLVSEARQPLDYPELRDVGAREQRFALTENRPKQTRWAVCRPWEAGGDAGQTAKPRA